MTNKEMILNKIEDSVLEFLCNLSILGVSISEEITLDEIVNKFREELMKKGISNEKISTNN